MTEPRFTELGEVALFAREDPVPQPLAVLTAAAEALARLVPSDLVGWNDVDMREPRAIVRTFPTGSVEDVWAGELLLRTADDHPMVRSYLTSPGDLSPRRMSDVVGRAELHRSRAYQELLSRIGGEHQATVLTTAFDAAGGHAWSFSRSTSDFTDADIERLQALQLLLTVIDRVILAAPQAPAPAADRYHLTAREADVLGALANGLTADAIGAFYGISGRTVRKHLEHAYEKLGAHDRVTAVLRFRGDGA